MLITLMHKYLKNPLGAILLVSIFIMLTGNYSLFTRIEQAYPFGTNNAFLLSLVVFFTLLTVMFFLLICHSKSTRWILAISLIVTSISAYYMDTFGVIIDVVMIDNIAQTNPQEFAGLLSMSLLFRLLILGVVPAYLVIKHCPESKGFLQEFKSNFFLLCLLFLLLIVIVAPFSANYLSFIREHKITRYYANPTYTYYSLIKYILQGLNKMEKIEPRHIAKDAVLIKSKKSRPELIIMVVGETARFDRFSLNGYGKQTNPLMAKQGVVSLTNISSCGTSTGVSVPCMFSALTRKQYSKQKGLSQENALDILSNNGVQVLWRDNNSDSKGVATRMKYEDFRSPTLNPDCQGECRDIGMLAGLDKYIEDRKGKDILIVLHQIGNHGPEYYRRYPKNFARFQPECMTGELKDCSQEEVDNSYDNAILYTDYFLSNIIDLLKKYDNHHATAMLYVSDHGESLGENGVYLHAAPYKFAPKEQTHVPAIVWLGKHFDYSKKQLLQYKDISLSHDDLFCSLLVAFEINTEICNSKKEMLMQNIDIPSELKRN